MESEARYAWVGATVVVLFLALAGGLYWLSGAAERLPTKRYTVYFQNQSLEGLQIGSEVRMQGIKVGRVADYTILPDQPRTVRVVLEVDKRVPVLEGVTAVISRNLLTGLAGVALKNPTHKGVPLMRAPPGERYPVIEEGVADITRMASLVEDMGRAGHETLQRLNRLLSDDNQRELAGSLRNIHGLSAELRRSLPQMNATLASVRASAERLDAAGAEVTGIVREAGERVSQAALATERTLAVAEQTLADARGSLAGMDRELGALSLQLRISADLATQEVQATAQSLRQAGEALQSAGRGLAEPGRILYGPLPAELGPGEGGP